MEIGHDKEIDVLLRNRELRAAAVAERSSFGGHLDADALAAFAENALPDGTRSFYVRHIADCGGCRAELRSLIELSGDHASAPAVAAPELAGRVSPWYKKIFFIPNLAYVMGGLVLIFGGLIGFTVLQNSMLSGPEMSQVAEEPAATSGPMAVEPLSFSNEIPTNSNASAAANSANVAARPAEAAPSPFTFEKPANAAANAARSNEALVKEEKKTGEQPTAPAAAAPMADEVARAAEPAPKDDRQRAPGTITLNQPQQAGRPQQAGKSSAGLYGPNRQAPTDSRAEDAEKRKALETAVVGTAERDTNKKMVGGKNFERRNNVWYDSEYRAQAATVIQRGSDSYKKLDAGLRTITDQLPGTVVIVWKTRAYRIQ